MSSAKRIFPLFLVVFPLFLLFPAHSHSAPSAKRLIALVEYIGGDYKNAVSGGEVVNREEYDEMLEFSAEAGELFKGLKSSEGDRDGIESDLNELAALIAARSSVSRVESLSKTIKGKLLASYNVASYPEKSPSYASGKSIYGASCAQCHGPLGAGDGPLAEGLSPAPLNFADKEIASGLSPFKVHNTITFGIEGTAMPSFPGLSDEEKWDVAFYVLSLGHEGRDTAAGERHLAGFPAGLSDYRELAVMSNGEIRRELGSLAAGEGAEDNALAYLRRGIFDKESGYDSPMLLTGSLLDQSVRLYKKGETGEAYTKALDAYLEGFEKVEPDLVLRDRDLASGLETRFSLFRSAIKSGKPAPEVERLSEEIKTGLAEAESVLRNGKPASAFLSFVNSFTIIVREGLEAILIIAAIIAFMGATGAGRQIKYIHLGWVLALVAGLLTWVLARTVISISGAQREVIEGVTSLVAAAVLFYVSYWLVSKIDVRMWKKYIQGKVEKALSRGSVFALAGVSFFAVYREAFETVLFYQALWFQAESAQTSIIWGIVAGSALLAVLFVVIFRLAMRIPLKYFFSVTSVFLYLLSFILLGKGIRELQEAGMVGVTPIEFLPSIDVLGFYPSIETAVPQAVLLAAFVFALVWLEYVKRERERKEIVFSVSRIAEDMKSMHAAFDHIKGHIVEWRRCEDIDLEAEDLDRRIQDVITHVDELEGKLGDFYTMVSKNRGPSRTQ